MPSRIKALPRITRQPNGYWTHPLMPKFTDIAQYQTWLHDNDLIDARVYLCDDTTARSCWQNFLLKDEEISAAAVNAWQPKPPEGEGWFLLAIVDDEGEPLAYFAKDTSPPDAPLTEEEKLGLPKLPPHDKQDPAAFYKADPGTKYYSESKLINYGKTAQLLQAAPQLEVLNEELNVRRQQLQRMMNTHNGYRDQVLRLLADIRTKLTPEEFAKITPSMWDAVDEAVVFTPEDEDE